MTYAHLPERCTQVCCCHKPLLWRQKKIIFLISCVSVLTTSILGRRCSTTTYRMLQQGRTTVLYRRLMLLSVTINHGVEWWHQWIMNWKGDRKSEPGARFPVAAKDYYLYHSIQTDSTVRPASYPMGSRGKAIETWNWLFTSILP